LAVVAIAAGLWLLSDRLLYIGPLDRATFGWLVVVPVWLLASVAAAVAWKPLAPTQVGRAAALSAILVGVAAAVLFWNALRSEWSACDFGPRTPAESWIVPALLVGALIGTAPSLGGRLSAQRLGSGRRWSAVGMALGVDAVLSVAAVLVATMFILSAGGCQRPI
jgi:hypothetical protein